MVSYLSFNISDQLNDKYRIGAEIIGSLVSLSKAIDHGPLCNDAESMEIKRSTLKAILLTLSQCIGFDHPEGYGKTLEVLEDYKAYLGDQFESVLASLGLASRILRMI